MSAEVYHLVPRTMRTIRQQAAELDALINIPFKAAARLGLNLTPEDQQDEGLIQAIEVLSDPENLERSLIACTEPSRKVALEGVRKSLLDGALESARKLDRFEIQGLAVFVRGALAEIDAAFATRVAPCLTLAAALNGSGPAREVLCRQVAALGEALARQRNTIAADLLLSQPGRYSRQQLHRLKTLCRKELGLPDADETFRILARRLAEKGGPDLVDMMVDLAREQDEADTTGFDKEAVRRVVSRFPVSRGEGEADAPAPAIRAAADALTDTIRNALDVCDASPDDVETLTTFAVIALNRRAYRAVAALIDNRESILGRADLSLGATEMGRRLDRLHRLLLTWPLSAGEAWDEARDFAASVSPDCLEALDDTVKDIGQGIAP